MEVVKGTGALIEDVVVVVVLVELDDVDDDIPIEMFIKAVVDEDVVLDVEMVEVL